MADKQLYSNIVPSATTFHGSNGHVIKDEVDFGNKNVLKPVDDNLSDENKLRPHGIQYARLQSLLNFKEVDDIHNTNSKFTWFRLLPTKSKKINIDQIRTKTFYNTFTGPSDWYCCKNSHKYWDH